jgi:hypothetical protein
MRGRAIWLLTLTLLLLGSFGLASFAPTHSVAKTLPAPTEASDELTATADRIELTSSVDTIPAVLGNEVIFTARVLDALGNPVPNHPVRFASDLGMLSPSEATTDASGEATTTLTNPELQTGTATVTASTTPQALDVSITADENELVAQLGNETSIRATITDATSGTPVVGETVTFETSLGSLSPQSTTTDDQGIAVATLSNPNLLTGDAVVSVRLETDIVATRSVQVVAAGLCNDIEPNNTRETSSFLITVNEACVASLEGEPEGRYGQDVYELVLSQDSNVTFFLRDIPAGADYDLLLATYDGTSSICRSVTRGSVEEKMTCSLPAGEYYVGIEPYTQAPPYTYTLSVVVSPASGISSMSSTTSAFYASTTVSFTALPCNDVEPNDLMREAKDLTTINAACQGSLADDPVGSEGDDYYKITVTETSQVVFFLRNIPSGADYDLQLGLWDEVTVICKSINEDNTDEYMVCPLSPGTDYYLRIYQYKKEAPHTYTLAAIITPETSSVIFNWDHQEFQGDTNPVPVAQGESYDDIHVWFNSVGDIQPDPTQLHLCLRKDPASSPPDDDSVFRHSNWQEVNWQVEGETVRWCAPETPTSNGSSYVFNVDFFGGENATSTTCTQGATGSYCREDFGIVYNDSGTYRWVRSTNGRTISSTRMDANVWWHLQPVSKEVIFEWVGQDFDERNGPIPVSQNGQQTDVNVWFKSIGEYQPDLNDLQLCLRKDVAASSPPEDDSHFRHANWQEFNQQVEGEMVFWCAPDATRATGNGTYAFSVDFSGNNTSPTTCSTGSSAPYCREDFGIVYNDNGTYRWVRSPNGRRISGSRMDANVWWQLDVDVSSPTATPTPTPSPTPIPSPSPTPVIDLEEPDDRCEQAHTIPSDGTVKHATFHQTDDVDWVHFATTPDEIYLIEANVPPESGADVAVEVYAQCSDEDASQQENRLHTPNALFTAPAGKYQKQFLLKLLHTGDQATTAETNLAYDLSVRPLRVDSEPGALILVTEALTRGNNLHEKFLHVSSRVYDLFHTDYQYKDERIYYMANSRETIVNTEPTKANLEKAITDWALDKIGPDKPLIIYLIGNGKSEGFSLDKRESADVGEVSVEELDTWLDRVEQERPGVAIIVIIESSYSGSFIDLEETISKKGRIIISSTNAEKPTKSSEEGMLFSGYFLSALDQGKRLYTSFAAAQDAVSAAGSSQSPWIDYNGDGSNDEESYDGPPGSLKPAQFWQMDALDWPPYIQAITGTQHIQVTDGTGTIQVTVLDDETVQDVWAVVYPPSYQPPEVGNEVVNEPQWVIDLTPVEEDASNEWEGSFDEFNEAGTYQLVVHASDNRGFEGYARTLEVHVEEQPQAAEQKVYLPLIQR